jgi:hypothetical protein
MVTILQALVGLGSSGPETIGNKQPFIMPEGKALKMRATRRRRDI